VEYNNIRQLTSQLHEKISAGTIDSPSWDLVRTAKLAARIYAPLGTRMSLGDYVRVIRTFLGAFKQETGDLHNILGHSTNHDINEVTDLERSKLRFDLKVIFFSLFSCENQ
jgi:glycerol-3-phosphate O-acyltransferase/dihydroxyacetone phosphate acyltransferase